MTYHARRTEGRDGAPLVLTFHGTGGDETQFHQLAEELMPGAHVVSPRGDVSEGGALRFFRRTAEGVYDMPDLARRSAAMGDFIAGEITRFQATRVIGLGYSNGANILAAVMFGRADLVREAMLMHPLIPFTPDPNPGLKGSRVLITAGEHDPIAPAQATKAISAYFEDQGALVQTSWHSGGHEIRDTEIADAYGFLSRIAA